MFYHIVLNHQVLKKNMFRSAYPLFATRSTLPYFLPCFLPHSLSSPSIYATPFYYLQNHNPNPPSSNPSARMAPPQIPQSLLPRTPTHRRHKPQATFRHDPRPLHLLPTNTIKSLQGLAHPRHARPFPSHRQLRTPHPAPPYRRTMSQASSPRHPGPFLEEDPGIGRGEDDGETAYTFRNGCPE